MLAELFFLSSPIFAAESKLSVTDYSGRVVALDQPARRIVSLGPHITENVFSAGAGEYLVGVVEYSDYPEAAKSITTVGGAYSFSVETIFDLSPDLVFVWSSGVPQELIQQLLDLGLVVYMDEPKRLEDIAKSILDIGTLTGKLSESQQASTEFLQKFKRLQHQYADKAVLSLFYQIWDQPLMTLSGQHIVNDVIRLCGGKNIFEEAAVIAPVVNMESILAINPDAIVSGGDDGLKLSWLKKWKKWPQLSAVTQDHLFFLPPDLLSRHTVRMLQGAEILCQHLQAVREPS